MQSLAFFQLGLHRFSFYHFSVNNDIIFVALNLLFSAFKPRNRLGRGVPVLKVSDPNPKKWVGG